MPMPTGGHWPPLAVSDAYDAYRDWDAWYGGDPDQLREVYATRRPTQPKVRPSQMSGGLVGTLSRWLWGNPTTAGQRDSDLRLHVPLPADLTSTAANLLFSESPRITSEDNPAAEERFEQLLENGFVTYLLHAAEAASALGDIYLRPVVDREISPDEVIPTAVHADSAIPMFRWGRLAEVTFWSVLAEEGQIVWRLLEHHSPGLIEYGLFKGGPFELGEREHFSEFPGLEDILGPDIITAEGLQETGLETLDVIHIPNSGPQRRWRTHPTLKYFGRSDIDGNEQLFDRIDEAWTSWMRDIRLAKARLTVPAVMLDNHGPGQGATFDADREIYSAINALPHDLSGNAITASQFEIRGQEHSATIEALTEAAMRHAGLASQTLGEEKDAGVVTATEVQSRERLSFITRGNRIQSWRPRLAQFIELMMQIEYLNNMSTIEPVAPTIEFDDSVSEAPEVMARTIELLHRAEAISTETAIRMVHPDWDDPAVTTEVDRISDERGQNVEDPDLFTGNGFTDPTDTDADEE